MHRPVRGFNVATCQRPEGCSSSIISGSGQSATGARGHVGQAPGGEQFRDIERIFTIALDAPTRQGTTLGGVGEQQFIDDRFEQIPQPAVKAHAFNGDDVRRWQRRKELDDLFAALAGDASFQHFAGGRLQGDDEEGVLVQVDGV